MRTKFAQSAWDDENVSWRWRLEVFNHHPPSAPRMLLQFPTCRGRRRRKRGRRSRWRTGRWTSWRWSSSPWPQKISFSLVERRDLVSASCSCQQVAVTHALKRLEWTQTTQKIETGYIIRNHSVITAEDPDRRLESGNWFWCVTIKPDEPSDYLVTSSRLSPCEQCKVLRCPLMR